MRQQLASSTTPGAKQLALYEQAQRWAASPNGQEILDDIEANLSITLQGMTIRQRKDFQQQMEKVRVRLQEEGYGIF